MDVPALHIVTCAILAVAGASFSAMDREFNVKAFFWHIGLAGFFGGMLPLMQKASFPSYVWYICTLPAFLVGFCVYGIAVALRKADSTAGTLNLIEILRNKLAKKGDQP